MLLECIDKARLKASKYELWVDPVLFTGCIDLWWTHGTPVNVAMYAPLTILCMYVGAPVNVNATIWTLQTNSLFMRFPYIYE